MLKWAVNGQNRQSHLQADNLSQNNIHPRNQRRSLSNAAIQQNSTTNLRQKLRRKSTGYETSHLRRKILNRDKENNLTSTPLPLSVQITSPLRKLDSLKDLSNITVNADRAQLSPITTPKNTSKLLMKDNLNSTPSKNMPAQYASTLPTFDVEYSPCATIPGPLLALRGIGIADAYFEQPRYLQDGKRPANTPLPSTPLLAHLSDFSFVHPKSVPHKINTTIQEEESLSSSRMGDVTLDRMIDAILESARKERRATRSKQNACPVMSPTYTPAEDPASDLNEIWDPRSSKYLPSEKKRKSLSGDPVNCFNEREVKTPDFKSSQTPSVIEDNGFSCHLKRQKAVRRKRKLSGNFIKSTVKNSAQRLFASSSFLRKNLEQLAEMDTPKSRGNISPDSGRNSPSDLEESTEENQCTKRRLCFSPDNLKDVQLQTL